MESPVKVISMDNLLAYTAQKAGLSHDLYASAAGSLQRRA
ncbi:Uncharacterised protein [uncultured archaeon]|nr:Uncharacterised protein [uncultured archaeon]